MVQYEQRLATATSGAGNSSNDVDVFSKGLKMSLWKALCVDSQVIATILAADALLAGMPFFASLAKTVLV